MNWNMIRSSGCTIGVKIMHAMEFWFCPFVEQFGSKWYQSWNRNIRCLQYPSPSPPNIPQHKRHGLRSWGCEGVFWHQTRRNPACLNTMSLPECPRDGTKKGLNGCKPFGVGEHKIKKKSDVRKNHTSHSMTPQQEKNLFEVGAWSFGEK